MQMHPSENNPAGAHTLLPLNIKMKYNPLFKILNSPFVNFIVRDQIRIFRVPYPFRFCERSVCLRFTK